MKTTRVQDTQPCEWFHLCDNPTDIVYDHGVLGPTRICERCANNLSIEIPKPTVGWNFVVHYSERGLKRLHRQFFLNPDASVCESNIRTSFQMWYPTAEILEMQRMSPIPEGSQGWGAGRWLETFERGNPDAGDIIHGEQADDLARSTE